MKIDGLKEIMCAVIGLMIILGAMWMLNDVYIEGGKTGDKFILDVYQRHMQTLNLALAFAGTVVGYYFGRMPAEKATAVAQAQTKDAIENQEKLKAGLRDVKGELTRAATPPSGGNAAPAQVSATQATAMQTAIQKIDLLL